MNQIKIELDKSIHNLLPGGQLGPRAALSSVFRGAAERVSDAGETKIEM